ncbi:MAG: orotidine-5'-phosphate decarboxylase [Clostridia bacterium]|nr:orotidine-5'-phosphate decarboxylase [Clostridia bacterium]MBQ8876208.1 orotidine-5'-phosphate decarboxylase [Clostridia bacterium]
MITDKLIDGIIAMQNPTCVGLDTLFDYLPDEMRAGAKTFDDVAERVLEFNKKIIDSVYDIVPSVKVQIAYYEMYGAAGMKAYYETLKYAAEKGLVVIADAKRNDIGSTASCYAKAFLGETQVNDEIIKAFPSDYVTVNGYLGSDGILPFVEQCEKHDKGIFVLVKTSNPSGAEIQNMVLENGMPMYEYVGGLVEKWGESTIGKYGYSAVGAVVGATHPTEAARLREVLPHTFFLIPGYGAQGGNAEMLKSCFGKDGLGGVVNNSRGILCAYKKNGGTYYDAARAACVAMQKDLASVIGKMGK